MITLLTNSKLTEEGRHCWVQRRMPFPLSFRVFFSFRRPARVVVEPVTTNSFRSGNLLRISLAYASTTFLWRTPITTISSFHSPTMSQTFRILTGAFGLSYSSTVLGAAEIRSNKVICWISAIMLSLRLFPVRAKYRWRMEKNSSMAF